MLILSTTRTVQTLSFALLKTPTLLKIISHLANNLPCHYNPMVVNFCWIFEPPGELFRLPILGLLLRPIKSQCPGMEPGICIYLFKRPPGGLHMKNLGSIAMNDTLASSQCPHIPSFMGMTRICHITYRAPCKMKTLS